MSSRAGQPREVLYLNPPRGTLSLYNGRLRPRGVPFSGFWPTMLHPFATVVYERIGISLVGVYESVGKSVISISERIKKD